MSALALAGKPKHVISVDDKAFRAALTAHAGTSNHPTGPSQAQAILDAKQTVEPNEKIEERLRAIQGEDLLLTLVEHWKKLSSEIRAYRTESDDLLSLNKKPLDLEADAAIEMAFALFTSRYKKIVGEISEDSLKEQATKQMLTDLILKTNQDRLLVAYGNKMLELSKDPKNKWDHATARIKIIEAMQQAEAKDPKFVSSLAKRVSDIPLNGASRRNNTDIRAVETIFSLKQGQFDPDTISLAQELIFNRHVKKEIWAEK